MCKKEKNDKNGGGIHFFPTETSAFPYLNGKWEEETEDCIIEIGNVKKRL